MTPIAAQLYSLRELGSIGYRAVELDHCAADMVTALAESYTYLSELEGAR
jgi:hypothetical protein